MESKIEDIIRNNKQLKQYLCENSLGTLSLQSVQNEENNWNIALINNLIFDISAAAKDMIIMTICAQTNVKLFKIHSNSMFTISNSDKETNLLDFHKFLSEKHQKICLNLINSAFG